MPILHIRQQRIAVRSEPNAPSDDAWGPIYGVLLRRKTTDQFVFDNPVPLPPEGIARIPECVMRKVSMPFQAELALVIKSSKRPGTRVGTDRQFISRVGINGAPGMGMLH